MTRGVDVTHLVGDLWIGSAPRSPKGYEKFDVIYFCAEEYQPAPSRFPRIRVRHCGFDDAALTPDMLTTALGAADAVTRDLIERRRTLVTCRMGRNRSAFVAALALHMLTGEPGQATAEFIAEKRRDPLGMPALTNDAFRSYLAGLA